MSVNAKDLIIFIFNKMRTLLYECENKGVGEALWCRRVRFYCTESMIYGRRREMSEGKLRPDRAARRAAIRIGMGEHVAV
jgi:hypothetical protein